MLKSGIKVESLIGIALLVFIFLLSFASYNVRLNKLPYDPDLEDDPFEFQPDVCGGHLAQDPITRLQDSATFIIAPYFDNRSGASVRVISIVHYQSVKELYCSFCCKNESNRVVVKANIDMHSDRFEFPYGATDVVCAEPQNCSPRYVSVHPSPEANAARPLKFEIKNRNREPSLLDFTVCISAMYGNYNNVLQFVQTVEMYKILGAQKVVIYKNNCSQSLEKVLGYYITEGTVEVRPWPIHVHLAVSSRWHHSQEGKDIGYYGQITALNDCIYRNMYKSNYVVLTDVDEIILPIMDADWGHMMQRLRKEHPTTGVFLFEDHVFPHNVFASTAEGFHFPSWSSVPGVNILQHISREPNQRGAFNNRKMIVDPKKVIQTSVHSVLKMFGNDAHISGKIAMSFHCRKPRRTDLTEGSLIRDPILWRYNASLIPNVDRVLHEANVLETGTVL